MQFLFEDHVLDIDRRELRRGAQEIAVEPQVFDLLVYMIQNRERVVTKMTCWTRFGPDVSFRSRT